MTSMIQQRPAQSPAERLVESIFDIEKVDATPASTTTVAAKNAIPEGTQVAYHVFPGTHYDIYDKNYRESAAMARDWFTQYL